MYIKYNDFLMNENLDYSEIIQIVKDDITSMNLEDPKVIHSCKEMMISLLRNNKEKYDKIINLIKIRNDIDNYNNKEKVPRYTLFEYLLNKSEYNIDLLIDKWKKFKKEEVNNE